VHHRKIKIKWRHPYNIQTI